MREILFRGFHPCDGLETVVVDGEKVKGRWVEGDVLSDSNGDTYITACKFTPMMPGFEKRTTLPISCNHPEEWVLSVDVPVFKVLPSTVGQYINVDCFGTKVFEHDVIAVEDEQGEIYRFCVAFGECGGTKNVKHKVGYMGFHFEARDEETKVCMKYGARDDILYWLNAYNCEVIGTVFDEEAPQ